MQPIKSMFGGTERVFEIKPASVPMLEAAMGRSLYAVLKSFTAGNWTFDDVAAVISFALHGPPKEMRQLWSLGLQAAVHGLAGPPLRYSPHPEVIATLQAEGHGNFAELAAEILTTAIFGERRNDD